MSESAEAQGQTRTDGSDSEAVDRRRRGYPGGRVVAVATLIVVATAVAEALLTDQIATWTGAVLVGGSVVAALVTRAGDRSLPAMMPPLAFLTAALIGGQLLVPSGRDAWWSRQAAMLLDVLGSNAVWVVVATALAVLIALVRHFADRHRAKRARA